MAIGSCPACGVVLAQRIGRCPSCQAWLGRRQTTVGVAAALLAVLAVCIIIVIRGPFGSNAPRLTVRMTEPICVRAADGRGTDGLATIENVNRVPVDVTIRVRGLDITDRSVIERTIGPFRNVPAGGVLPIEAYLDATPLKSVTFEAVVVNPSAPDRP